MHLLSFFKTQKKKKLSKEVKAEVNAIRRTRRAYEKYQKYKEYNCSTKNQNALKILQFICEKITNNVIHGRDAEIHLSYFVLQKEVFHDEITHQAIDTHLAKLRDAGAISWTYSKDTREKPKTPWRHRVFKIGNSKDIEAYMFDDFVQHPKKYPTGKIAKFIAKEQAKNGNCKKIINTSDYKKYFKKYLFIIFSQARKNKGCKVKFGGGNMNNKINTRENRMPVEKVLRLKNATLKGVKLKTGLDITEDIQNNSKLESYMVTAYKKFGQNWEKYINYVLKKLTSDGSKIRNLLWLLLSILSFRAIEAYQTSLEYKAPEGTVITQTFSIEETFGIPVTSYDSLKKNYQQWGYNDMSNLAKTNDNSNPANVAKLNQIATSLGRPSETPPPITEEQALSNLIAEIQERTGQSADNSQRAGKFLWERQQSITLLQARCAQVYRKIKELNPKFNWKDQTTFTKDANLDAESRMADFYERLFLKDLLPKLKESEVAYETAFNDILSGDWFIAYAFLLKRK